MGGFTLASGGVNSVVHLCQVVRSLPHKAGVTNVQFIATPQALLDHDKWSPGVKLVAQKNGTNQKEFTCAGLNRTDLGDGEDLMR